MSCRMVRAKISCQMVRAKCRVEWKELKCPVDWLERTFECKNNLKQNNLDFQTVGPEEYEIKIVKF